MKKTTTPHAIIIFLLLFVHIQAGFGQRQHLLFESSYEWNNNTYLNGFVNNQHCCDYSVTRTMEAARSGAGALRLEVHDTDAIVSSSIRSEVTMANNYTDTGERWYGLSFYLKDWTEDGSPQSILQWHPASPNGSAALGLLAHEGVITLVHGDPLQSWKYINTGPVVSNIWTDFVFHVKWDSTNNGYIQVWRDGVMVYDTSGIRTEYLGGQYIKVGINHYGWSIPVVDVVHERVFYVDDLRIGDGDATYDDVAPGPPQRKHLLFDAPFEGTNYLKGFSPPEYSSCCEYSVTQSRDFAREGAYAVKLLVNDTDEVVSGSHGSELVFEGDYDTGERWYGMSYYFGNYLNDSSNESILNWHPNSAGGGPVLALFVQADMLTLVHQTANSPWDDYHYEDITTVPLNQWADFVFHVKWAEDNTGFIEFYLNGTLVYSVYDVRTDWTDGQYMKVGINKFCWDAECDPAPTSHQRIIWVDAVRIGDENAEYEDVAPGGINSCTEPTATITATESCGGSPYYLVLSDATGPGPFDLWINDTTYYAVAVGDSIALVDAVEEHVFTTKTSSVDVSSPDASVELGMKFKSDKQGFIKGIRFYSHGSPDGVYEAHLWKADGTLLASATFPAVVSGGWEQIMFSTPVLIDADSVYIASYHTAGGLYTYSSGGFESRITNGSLTGLSTYESAGNGVYGYGSSPTFPSNTYNNTNYWVDVIFVAVGDEYHLLGITNSADCFRTGDLQTVTVIAEECSEELASKTKPLPVAAGTPEKPADFTLKQNYPNPFRGNTTIQYSLPQRAFVNLALYDINGRLIKVLVNGSREAGLYTLTINSGLLPGGIYYYRMQAGNFRQVKKMVVR